MKNYWLILIFVQLCVSCSINYAANGDISSATKIETKINAKNIGQGINNEEDLALRTDPATTQDTSLDELTTAVENKVEPQKLVSAKISSTLPDISGIWSVFFLNKKVGIVNIEQNKSSLRFLSAELPPSRGKLENSQFIQGIDWSLTAKIGGRVKKISWSNGVIWRRK